jgi:hypothetical protein
MSRGSLDHSGLMPVDLITLAHFSVSSAISFPKSVGDPARTVPRKSASRALILESASATFSSWRRSGHGETAEGVSIGRAYFCAQAECGNFTMIPLNGLLEIDGPHVVRSSGLHHSRAEKNNTAHKK